MFSMGSRSGVEIPLPHVYTDDSGRECIILVDIKLDNPPEIKMTSNITDYI